MLTSTSTVIITYGAGAMRFIWDSVWGFLFTANGSQWTIVIVILMGVVCLVIGGLRSVMRGVGRSSFCVIVVTMSIPPVGSGTNVFVESAYTKVAAVAAAIMKSPISIVRWVFFIFSA